MFLLSAFFVLSASIFSTSLFEVKSKISHLLTIYLFSFANILITGHLGSLFSVMNSEVFYLVIEGLLLAVMVLLWHRKMKPALLGPFKSMKGQAEKYNLFKNPDVLVLLAGIVIGMAFLAVLAYEVPPNNNDSISTHVVRIVYWLQNGHYRPWQTARIWQIIYPVNSQLVMYWSLLFSGSDHWLAFVQYIGAIVAALSVVGIAKEFIDDQPVGTVFSGLIFLTLPAVVLQMTTTQNDLITAAFVGLSFYFFVYGLKHEDLFHFIISGAAIGIAVGIKQTLVFLLPGWGLACLLLWLWYKKVSFKHLMVWAVSILVVFLMLGSQMYLINFIEYGSPFGPKEVVGQVTQATGSVRTAATQVGLNTIRFLYQFADPSGLPHPYWYYGITARTLVAENVFEFLNIPLESDISVTPPHQFNYDQVAILNEDEAWYGIVGFFTLIPTLITTLVWGLKKKEPISLSVFIITASFFFFVTLLRPGWDPYQGRYFMPVVLLCSSLNVFWFSKKTLRWIVGPLSVIFGLMIMFNAVLLNPAKPVLDTPKGFYYLYYDNPGVDKYLWTHEKNIFGYSRNEQITYQTKDYLSVCTIIDDTIPADTAMGYMIKSSYFQEYCFFGETFGRTVIPLEIDDLAYSTEMITRNDVKYILYHQYPLESIIPPLGFQLIASNTSDQIYIFSNSE